MLSDLPVHISTHELFVVFSLLCPAGEEGDSSFGGHSVSSQGEPIKCTNMETDKSCAEINTLVLVFIFCKTVM